MMINLILAWLSYNFNMIVEVEMVTTTFVTVVRNQTQKEKWARLSLSISYNLIISTINHFETINQFA